jgi:hypothetical protein
MQLVKFGPPVSTAKQPVESIFDLVAINWNDWSSSIETGGRHHVVRACCPCRPRCSLT